MTLRRTERIVRRIGSAVSVAAAAAALLLDSTNDLETVMLMVSAVSAGLLAFDTAMQWRAHSFWAWVLLSIAPIMKTVPTVWPKLRPDSGVLVQRYDRVGSLLFGVCVFGAMILLARPAKQAGAAASRFVAAVIGGTAITGALAGTSVAFLFDPSLGSEVSARVLETPTWFVVSGLLAATAIATSQATRLSFAFVLSLATGAATSALMAFALVRSPIDVGFWAVLFAAIAVSAGGTDGRLGWRSERTRRSNVAVIVALMAGFVGAASAISARSDRLAWSPGWALLGIMSLAMFALAMATKPRERTSTEHELVVTSDAEVERARAMAALHLDPTPTPEPVLEESLPHRHLAVAESLPQRQLVADEPLPHKAAVAVTTQSEIDAPPAQAAPREQPARSQRVHDERRMREGKQRQEKQESQRQGKQENEQALAATRSAPGNAQSNERQPEPVTALSDPSTVAIAKAAAEVRSAPAEQRHSLAPLKQAHHFDPSTGLLSAAGLQHSLSHAFATPRHGGHVTMLMFMIRDIDRIEEQHGRLASAAVTREVAHRVASLMPHGTGARFARSAYAVLFVADMSNVAETTKWLARVLLELRAPVEGASLGDKIDVVAGMAQCYEGEDVAEFVQRANQGLVRAAQIPEPTLVAMP